MIWYKIEASKGKHCGSDKERYLSKQSISRNTPQTLLSPRSKAVHQVLLPC